MQVFFVDFIASKQMQGALHKTKKAVSISIKKFYHFKNINKKL